MGFQVVFKKDVDVVVDSIEDAGATQAGQIRYENGNQYVIFKAGGTITAKRAIVISTYSGGEISVAESGNDGDCIGVAMASATPGQYLWIQTMGLATARTTATIVAYAEIGGEAGGIVDDGSAGKKFAVALEAKTAGAEQDIVIWIY